MDINLGSIIENITARKYLYGAYIIAGLILGSLQAWFGATEGVQPDWISQGLAVYGYLGIPMGTLALANTPAKMDAFPVAESYDTNVADPVE